MKYLKKVFIGISCLLGIVLLILIIDYIRLNVSYQKNKKAYTDTFNTPGVKDSYVPQGMAYDGQHNIVLQTSYNGKGNVSKLYITDLKSKKLIKELRLFNPDGTENNLHVGGIATDGKTIWITSDYQVNEYSFEEALNTDKDFIKSLKHSKLPIRGDFCYCRGVELWIGDFFLKPFYPVPNNTPLLFKYSTDNLDYDSPEIAISLPKMVQGMTITDNDEFIFTRSFTYLIKSDLVTYKNILNKKPDVYKVNKNLKISYYHFTNKDIIKNEKLPPMAEGLFYRDNELYILFESNSSHYPIAFPKMKKVIKKSTN